MEKKKLERAQIEQGMGHKKASVRRCGVARSLEKEDAFEESEEMDSEVFSEDDSTLSHQPHSSQQQAHSPQQTQSSHHQPQLCQPTIKTTAREADGTSEDSNNSAPETPAATSNASLLIINPAYLSAIPECDGI